MSNPPLVLPVAVTDQLSEAVKKALSPEEIRAAVLSEAERQAGERQNTEAAAATKAEETRKAAEAAEADKVFKRTVAINGREFEFEDSTELGLERQVTNALLVANAIQPAPVAKTEAAPAPTGPTEEEKVAARAELDLKFRRGEISPADYLEQAGVVDEVLAKRGISVDTIKQTVERNQNQQFEDSWAAATTTFLNSAAGADWPGGEQNKKILGMKLAQLGLIDAEDKVGAMAKAYAAMKEEGLVFAAEKPAAGAGAAAEAERARVAAAAEAERARVAAAAGGATRTAAPVVKESTSSSLFGQSSGVGAQVLTDKSGAAPKFDIPPDATPEQIMAAWKAQLQREGKDPNAEFVQTYQTRRS